MNSLLSNSILNIKSSPTFAISSKANKMKAEGINVISFSLGEPDFNTPTEALNYAHKALDEGFTKYTNIDGFTQLKQAVCNKFKEENNLEYSLDEVLVSAGAKQAIFNAFGASLNKGDEVIIPSPYWVSYADIVTFFGGKNIIVKTLPQNNFKITAEQLESAITPKTKWLMLNSPSNPTGEVYTKEELQKIANVLLKHKHVYVMSDDIYEHLIFDGGKFYNIVNVEPLLKQKTFVVNGVSKSYSMTGFRIGYAAMQNKEFIKAVVNLQGQATSNASSISQMAALGALKESKHFITKMRDTMQKRRDIAFEELSKITEFKVLKPSGAFYIFFDITALYGLKTPSGITLTNCSEVAEYFLQEAHVALVFGAAFGYEGFMRISYATSEELIYEGIKRIHLAVNNLKV